MRPFGRRGISLVELLVVISLIGMLIGMLLPAIQQARDAGARAECASNLRQLALALFQYHETEGHFPPPAKIYAPEPDCALVSLGWMTLILPYAGEEPLWHATIAACRSEPNTTVSPPHYAMRSVVKPFGCSADWLSAEPQRDSNGIIGSFSSYMGVAGGKNADGILTSKDRVRFGDIRDGSSNTMMVGERPTPGALNAGWWYTTIRLSEWPDANDRGPDCSMTVFASGDERCIGPIQYGPGTPWNDCDRRHFWSYHPSGANWAFADGSVHFLTYSARSVLPALSSRAGNEAIELVD